MTGPPSARQPIGEVPEVRAWLSQNFDHTLARQRSQIETAKLLVTFALGISAALDASALQVDRTSRSLCVVATVLLGLAFAAALLVILSDRVWEPNRAGVMDRLAQQPRPTSDVLDLFAELERDQSRWNDEIVRRVRAAAVVQLLLSGAAGTVAAVSLLLAKA